MAYQLLSFSEVVNAGSLVTSELGFQASASSTAVSHVLGSAVVSSESVAVVLALIGQNGDGDC